MWGFSSTTEASGTQRDAKQNLSLKQNAPQAKPDLKLSPKNIKLSNVCSSIYNSMVNANKHTRLLGLNRTAHSLQTDQLGLASVSFAAQHDPSCPNSKEHQRKVLRKRAFLSIRYLLCPNSRTKLLAHVRIRKQKGSFLKWVGGPFKKGHPRKSHTCMCQNLWVMEILIKGSKTIPPNPKKAGLLPAAHITNSDPKWRLSLFWFPFAAPNKGTGSKKIRLWI